MDPVLVAFLTSAQQFPAGTVAGGFLLTLHPAPAADGSQAADFTTLIPINAAVQDPTPGAPVGQLVFTVPAVPAGTYSGTLALVDAQNNPLAPAVAAAGTLVVTASAPVTLTLPVPTSLTLTAQ